MIGCTCDLMCPHPRVELRRFVNSAGVVTFTWQCQECGHRLGDKKARLITGLTYIESEEWRQRRAPIIERSQGTCELCRNAPSVHVHHLHYQTLGNERPCDLVAVCEPCHLFADRMRELDICPVHETDTRAAGKAVYERLFAARDLPVTVEAGES